MREWLKKLREEYGMTQMQLAEKLGISESYYAYIEGGNRQKSMDISLARKFSSIFGISVDQIADYENPGV